jgi:exodeoxyribonuclease VII large subunit
LKTSSASAKKPLFGHEPDFSLADAAADYSASTPTAAADWLTPDAQQMLEMLTLRFREMAQGMIAHLQYYERSLDDDSTRLIEHHERLVENAETRLNLAQQHLLSRADSYFLRQVERLGHLGANLNAFNPLTTLERGFAVASSIQPGGASVIHSVQQLPEGEEFFLRLSDGRLRAQVLSRESLPAIETTTGEPMLDTFPQSKPEA